MNHANKIRKEVGACLPSSEASKNMYVLIPTYVDFRYDLNLESKKHLGRYVYLGDF